MFPRVSCPLCVIDRTMLSGHVNVGLLKGFCEGKQSCSYAVNSHLLGVDLAEGCLVLCHHVASS